MSDKVTTPGGKRLEILGHLGKGTFGQVLKVRTEENSVFALKVIRNRTAFRRQAETEIELVRRAARACPAKRHPRDAPPNLDARYTPPLALGAGLAGARAGGYIWRRG